MATTTRSAKSARTIAGFAVFAAFLFSWLFALSLHNRLRIWLNQDQYRPSTFEVDGAVYNPARGDDFESYWLTGTVAGHKERLIPRFPPKFHPQDAADVQTLFPRGSTIHVLYNPSETEAIIQDETLRVLHFTPDFWREEQRLRNKLLCFVLLPPTLPLAIYYATRYLDRRSLSQRINVA